MKGDIGVEGGERSKDTGEVGPRTESRKRSDKGDDPMRRGQLLYPSRKFSNEFVVEESFRKGLVG